MSPTNKKVKAIKTTTNHQLRTTNRFMHSFKNRSYQKELLDGEDIPFADIKRNMEELDVINSRLGGHKITLEGISTLLKHRPLSKKSLTIVEIGCGGGDNLCAIKKWASRRGLAVKLCGIDINAECISYARAKTRNSGIQFLCSDYRLVPFPSKPDLVFSSLFCHHFTDEQLTGQLKWMQENSAVGFFINDLHRHSLAYYSIKILTAIFSKSYLVKNDAPLSVRRGFTKKDWQQLFGAAQITNYRCRWRWAFRWLITCNTHATPAKV